jgi:hypothetical protein
MNEIGEWSLALMTPDLLIFACVLLGEVPLQDCLPVLFSADPGCWLLRNTEGAWRS